MHGRRTLALMPTPRHGSSLTRVEGFYIVLENVYTEAAGSGVSPVVAER
jgi:hypothetical protein